MKKRGKANWRAGRIVLLVVIVGAAIFAVQGGEYGTSDLFRQKARHKRLVAQIDSLQRDVDSLRRVKKAIQTDPATQERIAREEFGMVKGDKEILYRFAEPGSTQVSVSKP
ncbi:MAG TPA: septum formation initiator family protein [Gemmatimonadaceae bacterium]